MKASNTRAVTGLYTASSKTVPLHIGGIVKGVPAAQRICSLPAHLNGGKAPTQRELRGILEGRSIVVAAEEVARVEEQRKFMESCKKQFMEQTGGGDVDALRHLQNSNYVLSRAVAAYEAEQRAKWLAAELVVFTSYSQLAPVHPTVAAEFSIRKLINGAIYAVRTRLDALWTGGPYATLEEAERNALAHLRGPEFAASSEHSNEFYNIVQHDHVTPMSGPAQFVVIFGKRTPSGQAERGALVVTGAMSRDEAIKLADLLERGCVKSPAECSPGEHGLFVDGTCVEEGVMTGHDFNRPQETKAPYFVFDEKAQCNVAGPFDTADAADVARHTIHEQRQAQTMGDDDRKAEAVTEFIRRFRVSETVAAANLRAHNWCINYASGAYRNARIVQLEHEIRGEIPDGSTWEGTEQMDELRALRRGGWHVKREEVAGESKKLCALRELVLAKRAYERAHAELVTAMGHNLPGIAEWLEANAPADGRDVDAGLLGRLAAIYDLVSRFPKEG